MSSDYPNSLFWQALQERVLVFDGAMGSNLQEYGLSDADFGGKQGYNDYLCLTKPEVVREVHEGFLRVGCDVLETNSFGGNRVKVEEYGLGERLYEINHAAARLARELADQYSSPERPRFVAGSMGPTGLLPSQDDPALSNITYGELSDMFREQAAPLIEGGCDLLIIETCVDMLELKAAVDGCRRYMRESGNHVPLAASVFILETAPTMLLGTDMTAVVATLEALPVDILGLNCSVGPELMREPLQYLSENCHLKLSCIPNAGLPLNVEDKTVYPLSPEALATHLKSFIEELGVSIVGGCCGTTPEHLDRVVQAIGVCPPTPRELDTLPQVSSGARAVSLRQEPAPLLVGERINSQGSRKVKECLLADDYDGILQIARAQVESGAHVLDVCTALTERADEGEQMCKLVKLLSMGVEAPLVIDSTEADVIDAALALYPGKAIINSIHMEDGRGKIDRTAPLAKRYGAALIALAIDEEGQTYETERKLQICRRMYDLCVGEYGIPPGDLLFDFGIFPVTTGQEELRNNAKATIDAIRRAPDELPGAGTVLGISNVSFGVKPFARTVLNSVMLHHAVKAGLTAAIANPRHITPYMEIPGEQRALCDDLLFNTRDDALARFIEYFEQQGKTTRPEQADPNADLTTEERIHWQILHRRKEGIEALIDDALTRHDPVTVLNTVLLPAMKDVGDRFGAGELILPFVLQSAEVMKRAVSYLERFLEKTEVVTKGKVVLATVFGDVHDIGKNLVNTILTNNGYTVYDLGKQVPINTILEKAQEVEADALALSALLVSTSKQMPLCVQECFRRGLSYPILIGGAAINRNFGRRITYVDEERSYPAGVYYGKDAFEGLAILDSLTGDGREEFVAGIQAEVVEFRQKQAAQKRVKRTASATARSAVRPVTPPNPPFWGWRKLQDLPLAELWDCFDLKSLFRLSWQAKNTSGEAWEKLLAEEFNPWLERLKRETETAGTLTPAALYGYFPVQADGNTLLVYDPGTATTGKGSVIARFEFPRQPDEMARAEHLCLADYFQPASSNVFDVGVFQVVTIGADATDRIQTTQDRGDYTYSFMFHGFATQTAEALAEWLHRRVRDEMGLLADQGRRYSWGYPACPDLAQHAELFRLLPAEQELGMELTSAHQLVPEHSTAALIVHHPAAKYFSMGQTRDEQLVSG